MTNKQKLKLAIILALAAILLIFAYTIFALLTQKEDRHYNVATYNLQNPWVQGDDIYYYTGSFFAKYNTTNGSISRLSDYLYINSGISSVSWDKQAVVFQTNPQQTDRDDAVVAAQELKVNPYLPHWWRYDFATKQYQLLNFSGIDECQPLTQLTSVLLGCIKPGKLGDTSSDVSIFDLQKRTSRKITANDNIVGDLTLLKNTLFYTVTSLGGQQSLNSINLSSGAHQTLYSSKGLISSYVPLDTNKIALNEITPNKAGSSTSHGSEDEGASDNLRQKLIILQNKEKIFDKNLDSYAVNLYQLQGQTFVSSRNGSINKVINNKLAQVGGSTRKPLSEGAFLFKINGKFFVINANGNLLSSPSSNRKGFKKPDSFVAGKNNDPKGKSWIDFDKGGTRSVFLFSNNIPVSRQQLTIGNMLEKEKFRPSEFNFKWVVDGVDFHAPVKPQATVIR